MDASSSEALSSAEVVQTASSYRAQLKLEATTRRWSVRLTPLSPRLIPRSVSRQSSPDEDWHGSDEEDDDDDDDDDEGSEDLSDFELIPIEIDPPDRGTKRKHQDDSKSVVKSKSSSHSSTDSPVILDDDDEEEEEDEADGDTASTSRKPPEPFIKRQKTTTLQEQTRVNIESVFTEELLRRTDSAMDGVEGYSRRRTLRDDVEGYSRRRTPSIGCRGGRKPSIGGSGGSGSGAAANFTEIYDAVKKSNPTANRVNNANKDADRASPSTVVAAIKAAKKEPAPIKFFSLGHAAPSSSFSSSIARAAASSSSSSASSFSSSIARATASSSSSASSFSSSIARSILTSKSNQYFPPYIPSSSTSTSTPSSTPSTFSMPISTETSQRKLVEMSATPASKSLTPASDSSAAASSSSSFAPIDPAPTTAAPPKEKSWDELVTLDVVSSAAKQNQQSDMIQLDDEDGGTGVGGKSVNDDDDVVAIGGKSPSEITSPFHFQSQYPQKEEDMIHPIWRKVTNKDPLFQSTRALEVAYGKLSDEGKRLFHNNNADKTEWMKRQKKMVLNGVTPHCVVCRHRFASWTYLEEHIAVDHFHEPLYKCRKCGSRFATTLSVAAHLNRVLDHRGGDIEQVYFYDLGKWSGMTARDAFSVKSTKNTHLSNLTRLKYLRKYLTVSNSSLVKRSNHFADNEIMWEMDESGEDVSRISYLRAECRCDICKLSEEDEEMIVEAKTPPPIWLEDPPPTHTESPPKDYLGNKSDSTSDPISVDVRDDYGDSTDIVPTIVSVASAQTVIDSSSTTSGVGVIPTIVSVGSAVNTPTVTTPTIVSVGTVSTSPLATTATIIAVGTAVHSPSAPTPTIVSVGTANTSPKVPTPTIVSVGTANTSPMVPTPTIVAVGSKVPTTISQQMDLETSSVLVAANEEETTNMRSKIMKIRQGKEDKATSPDTEESNTNAKIVCLDCGQEFAYKKSLERHHMSVHVGRRYPCSLCEKSFTQNGNLKAHMVTIHKKDVKGFGDGKMLEVLGTELESERPKEVETSFNDKPHGPETSKSTYNEKTATASTSTMSSGGEIGVAAAASRVNIVDKDAMSGDISSITPITEVDEDISTVAVIAANPPTSTLTTTSASSAPTRSTSRTPNVIRNIVGCNICKLGFPTFEDLKRHTTTVHTLGLSEFGRTTTTKTVKKSGPPPPPPPPSKATAPPPPPVEFNANKHKKHLITFADMQNAASQINEELIMDEKVPAERLWAVVKLMNGEKSSVEELTTDMAGQKSTMSLYTNYDEMLRLMSISLDESVEELKSRFAETETKLPLVNDHSVAITGPKSLCPLCWKSLVSCPHSGISIYEPRYLKNHLAIEHPREYVELHVCKCGQWAKREKDLDHHISCRHNKTVDEMRRCKDESRKIFNIKADFDDEEEEEKRDDKNEEPRWYSEDDDDTPPMIIYNCKLCLTTMLQPIHIHFHLVADHGVQMAMLRNFYQVVDRTDDEFQVEMYERDRYSAGVPGARRLGDHHVGERLWFLCYMCGAIMGEEIDLKAHLVCEHGAKTPIHTLVVNDHMVFREAEGVDMDLGGAIANATKNKMLYNNRPSTLHRGRNNVNAAGEEMSSTGDEASSDNDVVITGLMRQAAVAMDKTRDVQEVVTLDDDSDDDVVVESESRPGPDNGPDEADLASTLSSSVAISAEPVTLTADSAEPVTLIADSAEPVTLTADSAEPMTLEAVSEERVTLATDSPTMGTSPTLSTITEQMLDGTKTEQQPTTLETPEIVSKSTSNVSVSAKPFRTIASSLSSSLPGLALISTTRTPSPNVSTGSTMSANVSSICSIVNVVGTVEMSESEERAQNVAASKSAEESTTALPSVLAEEDDTTYAIEGKRIMETNPAADETSPATSNMIPAASDTIPATTDKIPATTDMIPANKDTLPATKDTMPATEDTIPATEDTIPATEETISATEETISATSHTIPATADSIPATEETILATSHTIPVTTETTSANEEILGATEETNSTTITATNPATAKTMETNLAATETTRETATKESEKERQMPEATEEKAEKDMTDHEKTDDENTIFQSQEEVTTRQLNESTTPLDSMRECAEDEDVNKHLV